MRHLIAFLGGLGVGHFFSILPALIETISGRDQCIESCPGWFKVFSWSAYAAMPLAWGVAFLVFTKSQFRLTRKRVLLALALASAALMSFIAFYGYAYQARLL